MILVTGGAGFIGSALVWQLNQNGYRDVLIADRLGNGQKWKNLSKRQFSRFIPKDSLIHWLDHEGQNIAIDAIFHLGACSSTTETDGDYLMANNLNYSIALWNYCCRYQIPLIYASSAATYGDGSLGFSDAPSVTASLNALNPYGFSKLKFDQFALNEPNSPPFWAGLRFFNVYGPQEYHKGSQASVMFHFMPQIKQNGVIKLFKSHRDDFGDGQQTRDFIYVKDVAKVLMHFYEHRKSNVPSGIYNLGTGIGRTFEDVAKACFSATSSNKANIEYIPMPEALQSQYQYFTVADLTRLKDVGKYTAPMTSLEAGVADYYSQYLLKKDSYL